MSILEELNNEFNSLNAQIKTHKRDAALYLRILIQIILTHGKEGLLPIDLSLSDQAQEIVDNCRIEIHTKGNGIQIHWQQPTNPRK